MVPFLNRLVRLTELVVWVTYMASCANMGIIIVTVVDLPTVC
jgi:hypothetical protein